MPDQLHVAIIVTGYNAEGPLLRAYLEASGLFPHVTPITPPGVNGVRSFMVAPSGAGDGYPAAEIFEQCRERFREYLRGFQFEDKSSPLDWVEVAYGHHDAPPAIVDDGQTDWRRAET